MKRNIFFFLPLFLSFHLFAQHSLESRLNMFRTGDEIIKQQVEYKNPGQAGENVVWDFSLLTPINDEYQLLYLEADSGKVAGMEHLTKYYYALSNDSLLLWGFENPTTRLENNQPELLLKFPVAYKDRTSCYYHGHGLYCNRLEMDAMGTVQTEADAYGMIVLPDKDTLHNVLRIRTVKYIADELKPIADDYYARSAEAKPIVSRNRIDERLTTDSTLMAVETFRWYLKGYRYPVFETVRSWVDKLQGAEIEYFGTSFFYPPQEHYYLEEDEENWMILEKERKERNERNEGNERNERNERNGGEVEPWEGLTCNFYPNPVVSDLDIEIFMPRAGQVRMQLMNRMGLIVWSEEFGAWPEGIHTAQVYMSDLPMGEYVLNMWFDDELVGEKIVKR